MTSNTCRKKIFTKWQPIQWCKNAQKQTSARRNYIKRLPT